MYSSALNIVIPKLELISVDVNESRRRINEISRDRKGKHPLEFPNAGSIFRNPPGNTAVLVNARRAGMTERPG